MQNLGACRLSVKESLENAQMNVQLLSMAYGYLASIAASDARFSTTPQTESGGASLGQGTTGLTDAMWEHARARVMDKLTAEYATQAQRILVSECIELVRHYLVSGASANGGGASQPPPSESRQDNWPGASSDPTFPRDPCAPTTAPTRTDLRGKLRTVEERLFSIAVRANRRGEREIASELETVMLSITEMMVQLAS